MSAEEAAKEVRRFLKQYAQKYPNVWSINDLRVVLALERMVARLSADEQLSDHLAEFILSEKLQTLVVRGSANSRAKDVFDLLFLIDRCFDKEAFWEAIQKTFEARSTEIPKSFSRFLGRMNFQVLALAWNSLQVVDQPISFYSAWDELKRKLMVLDERRE